MWFVLLFLALPILLYQATVIWVLGFFVKKMKDSAGFSQKEWPGISILVPVKGWIQGFDENFRSLLKLDYPGPLQLILAVKDPNDEVIRLAQKILSTTSTRVQAELSIGGRDAGSNPKNSNLIRGFSKATHSWIYCSDADVALEPSHLKRFMECTEGDLRNFASAIIFYEGARNFGARLEAIGTNVESTGFFLSSSQSRKYSAMNGAAMFFHRDLLRKVGGFEAVANTLTDDLVLRKCFVNVGACGKIAPSLIHANLESQSLQAFMSRLVRWILIVRCYEPKFFWSAPLSWVWQWMALMAVVSGNPACFLISGTAMLSRLTMAFTIQWRLGRNKMDLFNLFLLPIYDLLTPFAWTQALFTSEVSWAGQRFVVERDGRLTAYS